MSGSTFSPDGQWMWTGTEWVPAPPTSPSGSTSIVNSPIMVQQTELQIAKEYGENRLQQETLQEMTSFTDWTNIFISSEYRKRGMWIRFLMIGSPFIGFLIGLTIAVNWIGPLYESWTTVNSIAIFCSIICWPIGFKKFLSRRNFDKENAKKTYSVGIFGRKSWTKQLDPMITKYEHLVNWTHGKQDVETKRKLMAIEIELNRLLKARRRSQVLTTVAAGVAVGAVAKGFSQATGRK